MDQATSRGALGWWILLAASSLLAVVLLVLLLHAFGVIRLSMFAAARPQTYERNPLDVAMGVAQREIAAAVARDDLVRAAQAVERLEATAHGLRNRKLADEASVDAVLGGLPGLRAEIRARAHLREGAPRLAYLVLGEHVDRPAYPASLRTRLEELQAEARTRIERRWPVVRGLSFARIEAGRYSVGTPDTEPGRRPRDDQAPGTGLADRPVRRFRVPEAYWISTTEVTRAVYAAYAVAPSAWARDADASERPASHLTLRDARNFCAALGRTSRQFTFELPTESEWEIACRAQRLPAAGPVALSPEDRGKERFFTDLEAQRLGGERHERILADYGVFQFNARSALGRAGLQDPPMPVRTRRSNPLGLYDMHGNVAEWCLADGGDARGQGLLRGGSCQSAYEDLRAGARRRGTDQPSGSYGFRLVARRRATGG